MDNSKQDVIKTAFSGLGDKDLYSIINNSHTRNIEKGDVLIGKTDSRNTVYLVLKGSLSIVDRSRDTTVILENLGAGSFIGETGFTMDIARVAIAVARTDTSVLVIDKTTYESFNDKIRLFILEKMNDLAAKRIAELTHQTLESAKKTGLFRDYLKSHYVMNKQDYSQSELFTDIIRKIPRLPTFTTTLAGKILEDKLSLKEVAAYVQQDPALVGMVLKKINSAYYNFKNKVSSIQRAILLLGFNRLYQLLVSSGIQVILPETPEFKDLQEKAIAVSNIAYALSLNLKKADPVQVSTIALLKDLGSVVTYLLAKQNKRIKILIDSLDTSIMGAMLLQEWNLPKIIWRSVEYQNCITSMTPDDLPSDIADNVAILYLSELCYSRINKERTGPDATVFMSEYKSHLGVDNLSTREITARYIMPVMIKNIESYPEFLRIMLRSYL